MNTQTYIRNLAVSHLTLMAAMTLTTAARAHPKTVEVPAGSVNALAAAIAEAGSHGKVVLKSGVHSEDGEVLVTMPIRILGEPGAILETSTSPATTLPEAVIAALHLKNAPGATVQGIWFRPPDGTIGNCAVILEDSPGAQVLLNQMTGLQFGVFVQGSDHAVIRGNVINITLAWEDPINPLPDAEGIISNVGRHVQVIDNTVSNAIFGIFASDRAGELRGNTLSGNFYGVFFCDNKALFYPDSYIFSGSPQFGVVPATAWQAHGNTAHGNAWGFIVTDGSHENVLANNDVSGNGDPTVWGVLGYDIELTGDTARWAPLVPLADSSYDNLVVAGTYQGIVVKNCGTANVIRGHVTLVDTSTDPCY